MSDTNRADAFALTFWGYVKWRYRARHETLEAAKAEAERVLAKLDDRAAQPAVIYKAGERHPVVTVN